MLSTLSLMMLLLAAGTEAAGSASIAETASVTVTDAAQSSSKTCYAKRIEQQGKAAFDFQVMVPAAKAALATEKGYVPVSCSADRAQARYFRDRVCAMAAMNDAVQARTIEVLGIDPRKVCAAVKELRAADFGE